MNATAPDDLPADAGLADRIAAAQAAMTNMVADKTAEIPFKKADGTYGKFSYTYMTKSALLAAARAQLASRGVAILPSQVSITQDKNRTSVTVRVELRHGDEMFAIERTGYGHADDDKGPAKAGTSALRLAMADLLLQGGDEVSGDFAEQEYRADQQLSPGELVATAEQIRFATDLIMRAQLDKAMPTAAHALVRMARPISPDSVPTDIDPVEAVKLIPQGVMSKLIERLEAPAANPKGAKVVWDKVAEWEASHGYAKDVGPQTALPPLDSYDPPLNEDEQKKHALGVVPRPPSDDDIPF